VVRKSSKYIENNRSQDSHCWRELQIHKKRGLSRTLRNQRWTLYVQVCFSQFSTTVTNTYDNQLHRRKHLVWLMVSEVSVLDDFAPLFLGLQ
jgi:hypothetical protein